MSFTRQSHIPIDVNNTSTGVIDFNGLSINADTSKFNVGSVKGYWVDNTIPTSPIVIYKSFPVTPANVLIYLTTHNVTYIAIDVNGGIIQKTTPFEPEEQRDVIPLGAIIHSNRININAINNQPVVSLSPNNQLSDLMESIGFFNISGNVISSNGNNLSINKSEGHIFKQGSNFINNYKDPHTLFLPQLIAPSTIRYRLQNGIEYSNTSFIDPNNWDNNGVKEVISGTKWTVQRIYVFSSNLIRIQYGQALHTSLSHALQSIQSEPFIKEQNIKDNGLFRALLIVKSNSVNLSEAMFLSVPKFDDTSSFGSFGTTTLQQAYNNSLTPEIITNDVLGGLTIKKGETNVVLFEIKNSSDATTLFIDENGDVELHSIIMKSPDNNRWRITITNAGILTTTTLI